MRGTAWSKAAAGSVPSDRLRPAQQRTQQAPPKQNKGKGKIQEPLKSKAVRNLQSLAEGVRKSSGREKDPKGGCFCQGGILALLIWFKPLIYYSERTRPLSLHLHMPRLRVDPMYYQFALLRVPPLLCGAPLRRRSFLAFCPP